LLQSFKYRITIICKKRDDLISSFPFWVPFISFSYWSG
jgi:hypothetical protein